MTPHERTVHALRKRARAIPLTPGGFVSPRASALFAEARGIEEEASRRRDFERSVEAKIKRLTGKQKQSEKALEGLASHLGVVRKKQASS